MLHTCRASSSSFFFFSCQFPSVVHRTHTLPLIESIVSRLRGHCETRWPIRSHGQARILQYDSDRTVHHQSHLGTRTQFVDSKQAMPTAFELDPCPPASVPTMHFCDIRDLENHCGWSKWPAHTSSLSPGQRLSQRLDFRPRDNLRVLIRSLGSSTRAVFCLSYTTIVIRWIMSWNTHGISDIFITWLFRLAVGWISRQYIHHYFACHDYSLCWP
jgi:hypothetical protein